MPNKSLMPVVILILGITMLVFAEGQTATDETKDLFDMSLEELMDVEVTTHSKKAEHLFKSGAAIYVVSSEDIRRSGATSVPEALRMVPGVEVAQVNSAIYAISVRGFNYQHANKLLVMIDGRSIYNLTYGGVYWHMNDVMLEDVDRIEVIRGPGGTLWGANAVNGIINIITKNAEETQGTLLSVGGGTEEQGFGTIRHGGKLNDQTFYRVYSKYFNRDDRPQSTGSSGEDRWDMSQGGFRIDWNDEVELNKLTFQGDVYQMNFEQDGTIFSLTSPYSTPYVDIANAVGGNIMGRWEHELEDGSDISLQTFYDHMDTKEMILDEKRENFDIDFQHHFFAGQDHEITWGLGYRFSTYDTQSTLSVSLTPETGHLRIFSGFLQDKMTLVPEKLSFVLGTKLEHNSYSHFEYQPSGRLIWTPNEHNTVWAAVTRAVRTPTCFDRDATVTWTVFSAGPNTYKMANIGSHDFKSEKVMSYELGHRIKVNQDLNFDTALFFNSYDDIRSNELESTQFVATPVPHLLMPYRVDNMLSGETYGVEVLANWSVNSDWRLKAGYTFLQMQLHPGSASTSTSDQSWEGRSPHNQFHLSSYYSLYDNVDLDVSAKYVDNLPTDNIPAYLRLDGRLGWHVNKDLEISLVAQNLLDAKHPEFGSEYTFNQRAFYAKLTWKF